MTRLLRLPSIIIALFATALYLSKDLESIYEDGDGCPLKMLFSDFQIIDMRGSTPLPEIGREINEATRSLHYEINKAIMLYMPHAVPPLASDLKPFLGGLASFAHIYTTFERAASTLPSSAGSAPLLSFLSHTVPDSLKRTDQLKRDLDYIERTSGTTARDLFYSILQRTARALAEWKTDLEVRVQSKPHILLAYFWCMYMAIFAGGHFIKIELARAGVEFWEQDKGKKGDAALDHLGYSFLSFTESGDLNGLSIAAEFQRRLVGGESVLTGEQRKEVVAEAQLLYHTLVKVVTALAEDAGIVKEVAEKNATGYLPPPAMARDVDRPLSRWGVFKEILDIVLVCVLFAATWLIFVAVFM